MAKRRRKSSEQKGLLAAARDAVAEYLGSSSPASPPRSARYSAREQSLREIDRQRNGVRSRPGRGKPYSALTQNMAKQILALGPGVDPAFRAAAMDAVNGTGDWVNEKELQNVLRQATDVKKSGAGWVSRKLSAVRGFVKGAAQAGVMYDVAQRGGIQGSLATSELMQLATDKAEDLTHNKIVQKLAISVGGAIGKNPTTAMKFLRQLGRGLRLGGAIGTVIQAGVGVASEYVEHQRRGAEARLGSFKDARSMGIDARVANRTRSNVLTEGSLNRIERIKSFFGFNGDIEEDRRQRSAEVFQLVNSAREVAGRIGVDVDEILRRAATERGIAVQDLNEEEIRRALQPELLRAARGQVPESQVKAQLIKDQKLPNRADLWEREVVKKIPGGRWNYLNPATAPVVAAADAVKVAANFIDWLTTPNQERLEKDADEARTKIAERIVKNIQDEPAKQLAAQQRAVADVPPKFHMVDDGNGGKRMEVTPEFSRYQAERGATREQIRQSNMHQQAMLSRQKVSWSD